jgi:mannose-6-phosphate isomerase-like protein (cupin superfamily)
MTTPSAPVARVVPKPWGSELWFAHTDRYAGKLLRVNAGHRLSLQYHVHKDESAYLLSGRLKLVTGADKDALVEVEVEPGAIWHNAAGAIHTVEAITDCVVVEVSTPELDDVVRISDRYGREGTAAV